MSRKPSPSAAPARGKLLVLTPGMGAVSTTFFAGVEAVRRGLAEPVGSVTQMQVLGREEASAGPMPRIRDLLPLARLDDLVMAGWDVYPEDAYQAARRAGVLRAEDLEPVADFLRTIRPMPAAFDQRWVKRLDGGHVKRASGKAALAEALRQDIRQSREETGAARAVMVWCGSTEAFAHPAPCHASAEAFERALAENDPAISPSQLYAYAAIREGVPFANGAPNLTTDVPALEQLAEARGVPLAGKDLKTGQTLVKTALAPAFRARMLGVEGWYSTNILGNRDGAVLDDPESFRSKEVTKTAALGSILQADLYPQLYGNLHHRVRIDYYPPRGDAKEGWDNVDLVGWMGYPMQLKINFLCRDSILAAPLVLDLALLLDLAGRCGEAGVQEWLSFYFKSPQVAPGSVPEHDLFRQHRLLERALRRLGGLSATSDSE